MTEKEFRSLKTIIEESFGLSLKTHTRETLAKKTLPRLKALRLNSFSEYIAYVTDGPMAKAELHALPGYIMNTESYFLREYAQLQLFVDLFLEKKKQKILTAERTFRVLSAGCAEGQEPYSISMVLRNATDRLQGWDIGIWGLDVNVFALEKAQYGVYSSYSLRGPNTETIERHFQKTKSTSCDTPRECYRLKPEIVRSVEYKHGNILQPLVLQGLKKLDFIFCRNVLMYMSPRALERIVMNLWEALADDGYLFVGQSESLRKHEDLFIARQYPHVAVYQKRLAST